MPDLNYLLLAVKDPRRSAEIYDRLLGVKPVENAPTFVLYVLPTGLKVGLWAAGDMKPVPRQAGGVEQEPTRMDFGFTFVVADPDGHRLRPFALAADPR